MSKTKNSKPKFQPVLLASKEGLSAALTTLVRAKLDHVAKTTEMEQEIAAIRKRYSLPLEALERDIATHEAGIQVYCAANRTTLLPEGKKSIDLQNAVVGFRETPARIEKRKGDTWEALALQMAGYVVRGGLPADAPEGAEPPIVFNGEDYVRYPAPALDKEALHADRDTIPASVLKALGLRFEKDEVFFIEPKSEVIEPTKVEATA
jgi:phage host-nuclease inhibitor protein Gam